MYNPTVHKGYRFESYNTYWYVAIPENYTQPLLVLAVKNTNSTSQCKLVLTESYGKPVIKK